jgi:hypothetical protein
LRDVTHEVEAALSLAWNFFVWKNDPDAKSVYESVLPDLGTKAVMVSTMYAPETEFATMEPNSFQTRTGPIVDGMGLGGWCAAYITGDHVRTVLQRYGQNPFAGPASLSPRDYEVTQISAGPEMVIPDWPPREDVFCHFGSHVRNVHLDIVY